MDKANGRYRPLDSEAQLLTPDFLEVWLLTVLTHNAGLYGISAEKVCTFTPTTVCSRSQILKNSLNYIASK